MNTPKKTREKTCILTQLAWCHWSWHINSLNAKRCENILLSSVYVRLWLRFISVLLFCQSVFFLSEWGIFICLFPLYDMNEMNFRAEKPTTIDWLLKMSNSLNWLRSYIYIYIKIFIDWFSISRMEKCVYMYEYEYCVFFFGLECITCCLLFCIGCFFSLSPCPSVPVTHVKWMIVVEWGKKRCATSSTTENQNWFNEHYIGMRRLFAIFRKWKNQIQTHISRCLFVYIPDFDSGKNKVMKFYWFSHTFTPMFGRIQIESKWWHEQMITHGK